MKIGALVTVYSKVDHPYGLGLWSAWDGNPTVPRDAHRLGTFLTDDMGLVLDVCEGVPYEDARGSHGLKVLTTSGLVGWLSESFVRAVS